MPKQARPGNGARYKNGRRNIALTKKNAEELDAFADSLGVSRSAAINIILSTCLLELKKNKTLHIMF